MFKIGEFSKLTQVSIRMLRYYDEMGLLTPANIDSWTGYRMYSAEQISTLNKIIYLRDCGFCVFEIATILDHDNDVFLIEQLHQKYTTIVSTIDIEKEKLKKITLAKTELLHGKSEMHYHVSIKSIPPYYVLSLRRVIPNYYCEGSLWAEVSSFAKQKQIDISTTTFTQYHDEEYKEENVDVELCIPIKKKYENSDDFFFHDIAAVPYIASTMVYGDFSNISSAYLSLATWL